MPRAVAVWISPTHVGRFFGSMVVAYFAFGALLAAINFARADQGDGKGGKMPAEHR
jgi:hypothetical protein